MTTSERLLTEAQELQDTTREICSRLELDEVLVSIVQRANRMLGGDLAFLAICDDVLEVLRMRAFDNVHTDAFKSLTFPYGVGLGGAVARERRPISIDTYLDEGDTRLRHTNPVDDAVSDEGIIGAVAAPVEFDGRLLAVLYVGARGPRQFDEHQLTLLSSLANAAAIAINNAQIFGRLVASMKVHHELMEIALADLGPSAVARTLSDLVNGPVALLDWQARPIAHEPAAGRFLDLAPFVASASGTALIDVSPDVNVITLRLGGQTEGYLVADLAATENDFGVPAMEQASTVFALELAKLRSAEQAELRLRGGVITDLLSWPPHDAAELLRHAERLGCDLAANHVVAVVRFLDNDQAASVQEPLHRVARTMFEVSHALPGGSMAGERGNAIVVLTPAKDIAEAQRVIERGLARCETAQLPTVVAGLGSMVRSLDEYQQSYAEAARAVDTAVQKALGGVTRFDELNYYELVLGARPIADLATMAHRLLAPLIEYDQRRAGELTKTLRVFLDANGNAEATARDLGLHPNSLRARLARIAGLLGKDLASAETRLDLFLALRSI
jgi:sugar diacid utilization regulator